MTLTYIIRKIPFNIFNFGFTLDDSWRIFLFLLLYYQQSYLSNLRHQTSTIIDRIWVPFKLDFSFPSLSNGLVPQSVRPVYLEAPLLTSQKIPPPVFHPSPTPLPLSLPHSLSLSLPILNVKNLRREGGSQYHQGEIDKV